MTRADRRTLTIAGSDSSGGAGIQADLKTFTVMDCYGMAVITALTAQNTLGVQGISPVEPDFVRAQIDAVATDVGVDTVKTGMLSSAAIVNEVAAAARRYAWPRLVVDPVMIAKSGHHLLLPEARHAVITELLPLALVVTPNRHEAEVLADRPVQTLPQAYAAAQAILELGPRWVVLKGGHLDGEDSTDLVAGVDGQCYLLPARRVPTGNTHGTGCTFSAAIAAALAHGHDALEAIAVAKGFITRAIELAAALRIGHGHGPVDHCGAAGVDWRPQPSEVRQCDPGKLGL